MGGRWQRRHMTVRDKQWCCLQVSIAPTCTMDLSLGEEILGRAVCGFLWISNSAQVLKLAFRNVLRHIVQHPLEWLFLYKRHLSVSIMRVPGQQHRPLQYPTFFSHLLLPDQRCGMLSVLAVCPCAIDPLQGITDLKSTHHWPGSQWRQRCSVTCV